MARERADALMMGQFSVCLSVCLFVCLFVCLYVTILKNPYKTKTNKAKKLFFSVEGTYHRGNIS